MKKIVNPPLSLHWARTSLLWQDIRRAAALTGQVDRATHKRMFVFRFWCVLYQSARRLSYPPGGVRTRVLGTLEKGKGRCGGTWASSGTRRSNPAGLDGKPATNLHIWTLEVFPRLIKGINWEEFIRFPNNLQAYRKATLSPCRFAQWLACNEKSNHKDLHELIHNTLIASCLHMGNGSDYYGLVLLWQQRKQTEERQSELISRFPHTFIYSSPKEMRISIMISTPDIRRNF